MNSNWILFSTSKSTKNLTTGLSFDAGCAVFLCSMRLANPLQTSPHLLHVLSSCLSRCFLKLRRYLKLTSHTWHLCRFSFRWTISMCCLAVAGIANTIGHRSHLMPSLVCLTMWYFSRHLYRKLSEQCTHLKGLLGFSPVCFARWSLRTLLAEKCLWQYLHSNFLGESRTLLVLSVSETSTSVFERRFFIGLSSSLLSSDDFARSTSTFFFRRGGTISAWNSWNV